VSSFPIRIEDYGMEKPTNFNVLSIEDEGTVELQLHFVKAAR
jgi:hypothetical protein